MIFGFKRMKCSAIYISSSFFLPYYITKLKDGDNFDTKKSAGEAESLRKFKNHISENVPYKTLILVCCFNQTSKEKILQGFKNKIKPEEAFTGQEFCELIRIYYQAII